MALIKHAYALLHEVEVLQYVFAIKSWLTPHISKIQQHSRPHAFKFEACDNGKAGMFYKNWSSEGEWKGDENGNYFFMPAGSLSLSRGICHYYITMREQYGSHYNLEVDELNYLYAKVKPKDRFYVKENKTFYKGLNAKGDEDELDPLFAECVIGTILLSHKAFLNQAKFAAALERSFGAGLIVNGSLTEGDLSDYIMFLKTDYVSENSARNYNVAKHIGYIENNYWFLSPEVQISNGKLLDENEMQYMVMSEDQLGSMYLNPN
eukprot:gene9816-18387_t